MDISLCSQESFPRAPSHLLPQDHSTRADAMIFPIRIYLYIDIKDGEDHLLVHVDASGDSS